jgi:hypothetical protein
MLALVAHGLCDSQAVIMFLELCVMVASLVFLWWLFWGCWNLKLGQVVFFVFNRSRGIVK